MREQQQGLGLSFEFDPETKLLKANIAPDPASAPIDEPWLKTTLTEQGWGALRYHAAALMELLGKYNQGTPISGLPIAERVDATLNITISADGLEGTLDSEPAQGGEPLSRERILEALADKGVTVGVLSEAIDAAVATSDKIQGLIIAQGQQPQNGEDAWLESLQPTVRNRAPKIDEFGHTDYRDLGEILVVHPGDLLMRRHPPTNGIAGVTLLGLPIPAKAGKDIHFANNLSGSALANDDPDVLIAAISGQPVLVHDGMSVEPIFTIESVNAATGNIRFDGCVIIKGDVLAGMAVYATGDIEVNGVVEAATLEAGGNIVIKGGAMGELGHKEASGHHLRCGGSFYAVHALQARIEAGDSIFIDDMAMQCELIAVNCIRVGNTKRGHIIGGWAQATFSIVAKVIGSPKRVITRFEIGVNPILQKHLQDIIKNREARENQLFELSKALEFARKNPTKVHPDMIEKARKAAAALALEIAGIREEQNGIEQKIELSQQSHVIAEQAIYEGVEVSQGGARLRIMEEHGPGAIGLGEGGLAVLPLSDIAKESPSG